jgi:serine/threonine protein kinase
MYYTIFPWADGGSLKEFWKCPESRPSDGDHRDLLLWSLRQLRGVADALQALHRTNYRHGDLKPDNILHFKNGNPFCKDSKDVLVIADFGVSKKHRQETNMRVDGTNTRATTPSYEAPEVDGEQTDPRSRRYDMWSMGCILLEFVVWLLYGQDAIERFYEVRVHNCEVENRGASFYERRREEQEEEEEDSPNFGVNPAVEDVMNALKADPRCQGSTAIGDLLALIPQHLLQLEAEKRATANIWWRELDSVVSRAERDESYLVRGVGPSPAIPGAFDRKGKKARAKNPPNHNV